MYMGPNVIKSLTFHTNIRKAGPFGDEQGNSISTKIKEGKIVGFHGKSGLFLDAIGVHVMEGKVPVPVKNSPSNAVVPVSNHPSNAIVPVSNPSSSAIVPLGSQPTISEIDHPQWPNKLVLAKRGPAEEVKFKTRCDFAYKSRLVTFMFLVYANEVRFLYFVGCLWGRERTSSMWARTMGWGGREAVG